MKKVFRLLAAALLIIFALILMVPLLIALPPLPDLAPVEELTDPDSQFIEINGLKVHYKQAGSSGPALVLLHGFGASVYSWHAVMQPLAAANTVIAYDRPAFGLTSRPLPGDWTGSNPYTMDAQVDLLVALLDAKGIHQAILVGNSAGGTVAVSAALKVPQRVRALILVDAAVYSGGGFPTWSRSLMGTPQGRWFGTLIARQIQNRGMDLLRVAWHNPELIPQETITGYRKPLRMANWDRALWELSLAQQPAQLASRLSELNLPVLVITGDDDRIVPTQQSLRLAREIPGAQLDLLQFCGHVPQEECPETFLTSVNSFLSVIQEKDQ